MRHGGCRGDAHEDEEDIKAEMERGEKQGCIEQY